MTSVDRVMELCKEHAIPVYILERNLGFANAYLSRLKKELPYDRAKKIAEFFHVTPEYILTGEGSEDGGRPYYYDASTAEVAQELFDDPNMRILFDAARGSDPEALRLAAEMLKKMKESNPDG